MTFDTFLKLRFFAALHSVSSGGTPHAAKEGHRDRQCLVLLPSVSCVACTAAGPSAATGWISSSSIAWSKIFLPAAQICFRVRQTSDILSIRICSLIVQPERNYHLSLILGVNLNASSTRDLWRKELSWLGSTSGKKGGPQPQGTKKNQTTQETHPSKTTPTKPKNPKKQRNTARYTWKLMQAGKTCRRLLRRRFHTPGLQMS